MTTEQQLEACDANVIEKTKNIKKKRIWEIDFLRGLCVFLMVFDHLMFDLWYFGDAWGNLGLVDFAYYFYWESAFRNIIRYFVIATFFFLSGISSTFSKSNFYRAFKVLIFAYGVTFFTSFVDIDIRFGVLHAFGYSMLMYAVLDLFDKTFWSKLIIGVVLTVFGILILNGSGEFLRLSDNFQWLNNAIGFEGKRYSVDDYAPLLPWMGVLLLGSVAGKLFYKERKSLLQKLDTKITKPIEFLGRHALIIYPAHQVIMYGIFCLITIIMGAQLPF